MALAKRENRASGQPEEHRKCAVDREHCRVVGAANHLSDLLAPDNLRPVNCNLGACPQSCRFSREDIDAGVADGQKGAGEW